jgi:hypothetical protein
VDKEPHQQPEGASERGPISSTSTATRPFCSLARCVWREGGGGVSVQSLDRRGRIDRFRLIGQWAVFGLAGQSVVLCERALQLFRRRRTQH